MNVNATNHLRGECRLCGERASIFVTDGQGIESFYCEAHAAESGLEPAMNKAVLPPTIAAVPHGKRCEVCGQRPATFHVSDGAPGKATPADLCEHCAGQSGLKFGLRGGVARWP